MNSDWLVSGVKEAYRNLARLIGANGTALEIVGKVEEVEIVLGEMMFATDLVIVEGLTSEGIFGIDASLMHPRTSSIYPCGGRFVCLVDAFIVPPLSEVIVGASTSSEVQGTWLLDENSSRIVLFK